MTFLALPLIVAVSKIQGLYDRDELLIRKTTMDEAPQLFQLATLYALAIWLLDDILIAGSLSDGQVVVLWAALFGLAVLGRRLARCLVGALRPDRALPVHRRRGRLRAPAAASSPATRSRPSSWAACRSSARRAGGDRAATAQELRELIAWTGAHRIIIEPHALPTEEMLDFVRAAKSVGVRVSLVPRILDVVGSSVVFDDVQGVTLLGVRRFGLTRSSRMVKRASTSAARRSACCVAAPVMALIAIAIKLDSPRPGALPPDARRAATASTSGSSKFRTMCTDAEERKAELRARQRGRRPLQDRGRPARHARRPLAAPDLARRAPAAASTC